MERRDQAHPDLDIPSPLHSPFLDGSPDTQPVPESRAQALPLQLSSAEPGRLPYQNTGPPTRNLTSPKAPQHTSDKPISFLHPNGSPTTGSTSIPGSIHTPSSRPSTASTSDGHAEASQWTPPRRPPPLPTTPQGYTPSIGSATSSSAVHLDFSRPVTPSGHSRPLENPQRQPNPIFQNAAGTQSTSSVTSSLRSTSASSPLYYIKKPATGLSLPFLNKEANPETVQQFMEVARQQEEKMLRTVHHQSAFMVFWYFLIACFIYFGLIGFPLWDGIVRFLWKWLQSETHFQYGFLVFLLWGTVIAWMPLVFSSLEEKVDDVEKRDASETCLIIPAYKAANALPETIICALKIFKPEQIFIIANGNSPTPLDNTEDVCKGFGVNHTWVPVGSKITAEFVGTMLASRYKYVLLIDDDVHLPANLPLVTDRIKGKTACIGYTIKSTGANGSKGTWVQQAQDMEYKISGMTRVFQGRYGSATFPHGAIILWDRNVLEQLFWAHPGFTISEDWYFGHTCRSSGYRIQFCSQVFVETETPPSLFLPVKSSRGGYGEMTIWKQRFYRWNFFYLYRLIDDLAYFFLAWRLGRYEIMTKMFVLSELYDTFMYISRPFMLPITLAVNPKLSLILTASLLAVYVLAVTFFNAWHLRRKKEAVSWKIIPIYFGMKFILIFVNTASVYYSLFAYAKYFSVRHPRVTENYKALDAARVCFANVQAEMDEKNERGDEASLHAQHPQQSMTVV